MKHTGDTQDGSVFEKDGVGIYGREDFLAFDAQEPEIELFRKHERTGRPLVPYHLVFCHKKQENYAAILRSCSVDAAKNAFNMFVNFTPLSVI